MLICNKSVKVLQGGGGYQQFIDILDSREYKPYLNPGPAGQDFYYRSQIKGFINLNGDGFTLED